MKGYIYILTNRSMPNLVKIGKTHRNPDERAEELSRATGVATPFDVVYYECFEDCDKTEKLIHQLLQDKGLRLSNNREFFEYNQKFNIKKIIDLISRLDDKIEEDELLEYNNNDDEDNITDLDNYVDSLIKEAYNYANGENGCLIDYDKAEELLLKAISIGNSEEAYKDLIDLYNLDLDNIEKAIEVCKDAIKSGHKGLYLKLAFLYDMLYMDSQDDVDLKNARISIDNYIGLPAIYKDYKYDKFNYLMLLTSHIDKIIQDKQKIKELYSEYYNTLKNTFFKKLKNLDFNTLFSNNFYDNFYEFKAFFELSKFLDREEFYKKLNALNIAKNKTYFNIILKDNEDKIFSIKDNERLLDFVLEITNEEHEEKYKKEESERLEKLELAKERSYYPFLKKTFFKKLKIDLIRGNLDGVFCNANEKTNKVTESFYSFLRLIEVSKFVNDDDFYRKIKKIYNVSHNEIFLKTLKDNRSKLLSISDNKELLDSIFNIYKNQEEELQYQITKENLNKIKKDKSEKFIISKWLFYIGITYLTICIMLAATQDVDDKIPVILCFSILYIIAIFMVNICFANKK